MRRAGSALDGGDRVGDRGAGTGELSPRSASISVSMRCSSSPAPRVGLVEVDLGAEEVAGVARVLLAADRLLVASARGELLLQERRELGVGRARLDRMLGEVGLERGRYVGCLGDLLGEHARHVAAAAGPAGPGADLAGRLEHLPARADVAVVGLVEQGGAVVGQRLRHRAQPGRDRGPVLGRLGRHQVEGAADPVHGAVDDVDHATGAGAPRSGRARCRPAPGTSSAPPARGRRTASSAAISARARRSSVLAGGVAVRGEVGQLGPRGRRCRRTSP